MASGPRQPRSLLASSRIKRVPPALKDDKFMRHGQLLLSMSQTPVALERLLAVAKLCIVFLTDMLRRSDDMQDIPLMIIGHHYLSHRQLGEGDVDAAAAAAGSTGSGPAAVPPAAAGAAGGTTYAAYVQEICTFDAAEGPKTFVGAKGVPVARLDFAINPIAMARAKRIGRDLSIKVDLAGGGSAVLLEKQEDYVIGSWPAMHLLAPTNATCPIAFKGELAISCPNNGLLLTLNFNKDGSVKGAIEQMQDAPPPLAAAAAAGFSAAIAAAEAVGGARTQLLGSMTGSWLSAVTISCPTLGLEGVLYDSSSYKPYPVTSVDLAHLGPMRLPRFWSAVHDAILYTDPRMANGGRAAVKLSNTMAHHLKALTLDNALSPKQQANAPPNASAAVGAASGDKPAAAAAASGGGHRHGRSFSRMSSLLNSARSVASSTGGSFTTAGVPSSAGSDADLEEFDRSVNNEAGRDTTGNDGTEDNRAVPPCYKAQHAGGKKLRYQLHYTLTSLPALAAAEEQ